ncbi:BppU family phage baseplate upper protein [Desulforamulus aeronauticus]|uniref:BppU N-terminal domain-containing protein n=1 Tax=Desulforamulus aeronauticus DSM 10349 TaxID=1121421 RepID=A0A1M6TYC1_9FIRM|nr:BppU family phage baseplate upper protein [Desulforamulus aeronauticus]SHK61901.1 protein of unknown function [Desulforamulus aeronauticus DSM 10349]
MLLKKYELSLGIKREKAVIVPAPTIEFVQGDIGTCTLDISIRDMNNPVDLSELSVEIVFAKPDGTIVIQDLANGVNITDTVNGKITCILKTNTIAAAGLVQAEVRLLDMDRAKLLTTTSFSFYVRKALLNDEAIESTNELPILQQLITDVKNLEGKQGPQGEPGPAGASAYDLWLMQGNTGTVDDFWRDVMFGAQGPNIYPTPFTWGSLTSGQFEILDQMQHGGRVLKLWQPWTWLDGTTTVELIPGELYRVSYYARKDGTEFNNVEARFIIPYDGGSYDYVLGSEDGTRVISNDWRLFTTEFRWQGENERHRAYVQTNEANINNPVYFAMPSLRRINTANADR